jgi:hypothetical protein
MEMEVLTPGEIDGVAAREMGKVGADHPWYGPIREAIGAWTETMKSAVAAGQGGVVEIEIHAVRIGGVTMVG